MRCKEYRQLLWVVKQGCILGVATWKYTEETKGVDDLIKNKGIEEFERIMDELQPFKEWLKSIAAKDKNDEVLLRLNFILVITAIYG
ncbi:MAG: hypothetical protein QNJ70_26215 [Xenococcaceae cyanobacterium MO_207.B15]|nr:hypothetical protein [Xenococcaceae cyanobacterium MO_207.B15]MDJ0745225.1 hypothetical protein [Xenococcaceae cyanobacterium MO_167.B27]